MTKLTILKCALLLLSTLTTLCNCYLQAGCIFNLFHLDTKPPFGWESEHPVQSTNSRFSFCPDICRKPPVLQSPWKHPPGRADDAVPRGVRQPAGGRRPEGESPVQGPVREKHWLGAGCQPRVLQFFHQPHWQLHGPGQVGRSVFFQRGRVAARRQGLSYRFYSLAHEVHYHRYKLIVLYGYT